MRKMQAAQWYGPEDLRVEEVEIPKVGEGEVLVKIGAAMTCGTDFKFFRRGHALLVKNIPSSFGHEMSGTIVEVGAHVKGFNVNDRVVAANSAPCGNCFFCKRQQENLCENLEFLNGAYAEYIRVPAKIVEKNLYKIPPSVSFQEAACTEPLACALHCIEKVNLKPTETLCVIGAGPCGLLFVQLAKLAGARVICLGRGREKLEIAKKLGADEVVSVLEEDFKEKVKKLTDSYKGPDVVIEVTGQPPIWEFATELVRKGGRVWFYGGCSKGTTVSLDTYRLHYEQLSLAGVFHHTPFHFASSLALITEKKIDVSQLIVGEKKLAQLTEVFRKCDSKNPLKIAIIP